jgi:hypothetical protein
MAPELNKEGASMSFGWPEFHSFYAGECNPIRLAFKTFEETERTAVGSTG